MTKTQTTIHNEDDMAALAASCAATARNGDIFLLNGDLGAGKTAFARAFIRSLMGQDIEVPSPTFTLVQQYETPQHLIWHFDLYRLESPEEIYELGWEDALSDGIILIEWPQRLGHLLNHLQDSLSPQKLKMIEITIMDATTRQITIKDTQYS